MSTIINIDLPEWVQDKAWIEKLLAVVSGNSMEIGLAVTDAATISAVVTIQLE